MFLDLSCFGSGQGENRENILLNIFSSYFLIVIK